ncbi:ATP-binding cassette domain-containing protein [Leuconostocaceae bacterium ESL0958]|nr:ATP-binding cassette domain-containing protein [Leuconostocaceae bacterium ESL0958]
MTAVISVADYQATFGQKTILKQVSFTLKGPAFTVILGENGAGKTTLMKAVLKAALAPHPGSAIQVQADRLAYVPQFRDLGDDYPLSIAAFVGLGLNRGFRPWTTAAEKKRLRWALAQVDLADKADLALAAASGGQKQRAYIAQALVQQPDLLILDEPTASLDAKHTAVLIARLRALQQETGMLVLFISHDTSWVSQYADNYLWLHDQQVTVGAAAALPQAAQSKHSEEVHHV